MNASATLEQPLAVTDTALIAAHLEGNKDAFQELVCRYQDRLVNYVNSLVHDYEQAVDLAQEAFIRVFQNAHRCNLDSQFSSWIYRIATNLAIDEIRRRRRKGRCFLYNVLAFPTRGREPYPLPDRRPSPERQLDRKERRQRLRAALASLPERYRLPLLLREVEELPYEEVARVLGISLGTVKSRLHRAKSLLREKLNVIL